MEVIVKATITTTITFEVYDLFLSTLSALLVLLYFHLSQTYTLMGYVKSKSIVPSWCKFLFLFYLFKFN